MAFLTSRQQLAESQFRLVSWKANIMGTKDISDFKQKIFLSIHCCSQYIVFARFKLEEKRFTLRSFIVYLKAMKPHKMILTWIKITTSY